LSCFKTCAKVLCFVRLFVFNSKISCFNLFSSNIKLFCSLNYELISSKRLFNSVFYFLLVFLLLLIVSIILFFFSVNLFIKHLVFVLILKKPVTIPLYSYVMKRQQISTKVCDELY
jgi:hypothetical protein